MKHLIRLSILGICVAVLAAMAVFAPVYSNIVHASPMQKNAASSSAHRIVVRTTTVSRTFAVYGPGTGSNSSGYWHTQITITEYIDAGVVSYGVTGKCWVNSDIFYDPYGLQYVLDCSVMSNPHPGNSNTWQLVDWHTAQASYDDGVFPDPAAQLYFGSYGSGANVEWSLQVISTESAIRANTAEAWYTLNTPPNNNDEITATT